MKEKTTTSDTTSAETKDTTQEPSDTKTTEVKQTPKDYTKDHKAMKKALQAYFDAFEGNTERSIRVDIFQNITGYASVITNIGLTTLKPEVGYFDRLPNEETKE